MKRFALIFAFTIFISLANYSHAFADVSLTSVLSSSTENSITVTGVVVGSTAPYQDVLFCGAYTSHDDLFANLGTAGCFGVSIPAGGGNGFSNTAPCTPSTDSTIAQNGTLCYYALINAKKTGSGAVIIEGSVKLKPPSVVMDPVKALADINAAIKLPNPVKGATDLNGFINKIVTWMMFIVTPVLILMLIYSGFLFVTAQGEAEKLTEAKRTLIYVIVGAKTLSVIIGNSVNCLVDGTGC